MSVGYLLVSCILALALGVIFFKSAPRAVLCLLGICICISCISVYLGAELFGITLLLAYVPVVIVLLLSTVMMLQVRPSYTGQLNYSRLAAFLVALLTAIYTLKTTLGTLLPDKSSLFLVADISAIANLMYEESFFSFQIVGLMLLVSVMGAVILVANKKNRPKIPKQHRSKLQMVNITPGAPAKNIKDEH